MNDAIKLGLALAMIGWSAAAGAESKYRITDTERAACQDDAVNLCSATYPDEDALLACMKTNVSKLTSGCRPVFLEGLRRRQLQ